MYKGTIALDIDGTITDSRHLLPEEVVSFLTSLHEEKWNIVFITGREFVYAMQALSPLNFPYYLATQNGADLIKMPERDHLKSFYFHQSVAKDLEKFFEEIGQDFLLYSGYEKGDFCYYRPDKQLKELKGPLEGMEKRSARPWQIVKDFDIQGQQMFPMIKAIGYEKDFIDLESKILKDHSLNYVTIKDPKTNLYHYLLITDLKASKKEALDYLMKNFDLSRPLIVGGDDLNDRESLEFADVRVVMENAPASLKSIADIIAPLSIHHGIIEGLNKAIDYIQKEGFKHRWG